MADQYSARPTGDSVSNVRSGYALKSLQSLGLGLNKSTTTSILLFMAGLHIVLADITSSTANNAVWPTLVIGYGLLFATLMMFERRQLIISQSFIDDTPAPLMSVPSQVATHEAPTATRDNLTALHHARQQTPMNTSLVMSATAHRTPSADWTDLMSQVSHELRTPLNAMIGFSDVMNAELLGPLENPKYREYLAHIRDSGQELLKSAEDTLAMTSLLANRPAFEGLTQTSNLTDTLLESWSFFAAEADNKSISLKLDFADGLNVNADNRPLKQTFVNLFSEAVKRTAQDGTIIVRANQCGEIVEIEVSTQCSKPPQSKTAASLSLAIAQALLELQGTTLVTGVSDIGIWSATTLFDCPMQSDFFSD